MYTRVLSGHGVILNHYFGICLSTIFHWGYSHASWIIYTVSESNNSSLFAPVLSWRSWSCPDSVTTPDNRKQGKKAQRTETAKSPHCSEVKISSDIVFLGFCYSRPAGDTIYIRVSRNTLLQLLLSKSLGMANDWTWVMERQAKTCYRGIGQVFRWVLDEVDVTEAWHWHTQYTLIYKSVHSKNGTIENSTQLMRWSNCSSNPRMNDFTELERSRNEGCMDSSAGKLWTQTPTNHLLFNVQASLMPASRMKQIPHKVHENKCSIHGDWGISASFSTTSASQPQNTIDLTIYIDACENQNFHTMGRDS